MAATAVPETTPNCPSLDTARARRQSETAAPIPPCMMDGKGISAFDRERFGSFPSTANFARQFHAVNAILCARAEVVKEACSQTEAAVVHWPPKRKGAATCGPLHLLCVIRITCTQNLLPPSGTPAHPMAEGRG